MIYYDDAPGKTQAKDKAHDIPDFWKRAAVIRESNLTPRQKWMLRVIADYAGEKGFCFASFATLQRDCSMARSQIYQTIKSLAGILIKENRNGQRGFVIDYAKIPGPRQSGNPDDCSEPHPPSPEIQTGSSGNPDKIVFKDTAPARKPGQDIPEIQTAFSGNPDAVVRESGIALYTERETNIQGTYSSTSMREDENLESRSANNSSLSLGDVLVKWNQIPGVRRCSSLTPTRKQKLASLTKDDFWKSNWRPAMETLRKISWIRGKNDRNWVATIDWFLRPDTVARIIEGDFEDHKKISKLDRGIYEYLQRYEQFSDGPEIVDAQTA